jgi:DNA invertase Pin-like site-specific DNA recombinase
VPATRDKHNTTAAAKIVAYLRCSTARQQESVAIRRWAKARGRRVVSWQTDTISGTSELTQRAGWVADEQLVKDRKAGGIVVARLDRLARDVLVQELLLRHTDRLGGAVMSARESENELSGMSQKTRAASSFARSWARSASTTGI